MKTNRLTIGILAHVDAGKTTLSESILYLTGKIKKQGRVDHKDAYLDTYDLEKDRGITIFSKQAEFDLDQFKMTLLDTPGHVDFSGGEMERTLQVLDYAILVINGSDGGVQGHTLTLWKLLSRYHIPTFIFVNKMDLVGTSRKELLTNIHKRMDSNCIDFNNIDSEESQEALALCDELLMEQYIENGTMSISDIKGSIHKRKVFPIFFGSALQNDGVDSLLKALSQYMSSKSYPDVFGARVFKVSRDQQGERLTYIKVTGGSLEVKGLLISNGENGWSEKVDQIRRYSGVSFDSLTMVEAGEICAVTGLNSAKPGDGLGFENKNDDAVIVPVLSYKVEYPDEIASYTMLKYLRILEEEEPHLNVLWNEHLGELHVQVMGDIQIEILRSIIASRFGIEVTFDKGNLVYRETIEAPVIGRGHFEPLKHYAEVHLYLEPLSKGSGMVYETKCSTDLLDKNWQRLILAHLKERQHCGVLTGSELTDMKISLIAGRGHNKHTEGGDFREATFRALRQGLMKAKCKLLEPVYDFSLEVPKEMLGRAMSDIEKMYGQYKDPVIESDKAVLTGIAPVETMMHYNTQVMSYTKGLGQLSLEFAGYEVCHKEEAVIELIGYKAELDTNNPSGSVFCSKGVGFGVAWEEADSHMHVESTVKIESEIGDEKATEDEVLIKKPSYRSGNGISDSELDAIFTKTYGEQKERKHGPSGRMRSRRNINAGNKQSVGGIQKVSEVEEKYLLVDGYNIIFAWDELKELAAQHMDSARAKLMDILCNYQSQTGQLVILVFDAYRVSGNRGNAFDYHNIHVVFTKEAETADRYIEDLVHEIRPKCEVTVATSDVVEQVIIMGKGGRRLSAEHFKTEIDHVNKIIRDNYTNNQVGHKNRPFDGKLNPDK